ncbi:hypothetical protein yc1106_10138 [Curvularia clavata]|uniref:AA1-like domain-containing protein n=1 Tax=Curvularia clavata TaxID=95742 RepID=A0A9Q8ZJX4_CURCL|nr:hypothetical protein yc1106_10138 [Curvularia clavata]
MKFFIAAALFAGAAVALPAASECGEMVTITDYSLRWNFNQVESVSFKLSGNNATDLECTSPSGAIQQIPSPVYTCGDSKYRFGLQPVQSGFNMNDPQYNIAVYHETGPAVGLYAQTQVPTYCRAGGVSTSDRICNQIPDTWSFNLNCS